jgi:hypothetical protein
MSVRDNLARPSKLELRLGYLAGKVGLGRLRSRTSTPLIPHCNDVSVISDAV